jgi:hypothetical protein
MDNLHDCMYNGYKSVNIRWIISKIVTCWKFIQLWHIASWGWQRVTQLTLQTQAHDINKTKIEWIFWLFDASIKWYIQCQW